MQTEVKKYIEKVLECEIVLEKPKDIALGHYALPIAFSLAKVLRKNPNIIAEELASKFDNDENHNSIFQKVEAVKGFVNFRLKNEFIQKQVELALELEDNFGKKNRNNETVLLEYVSANPTGPLHIGHARGAILGDTLAKVGNYLGYDIKREYYVNDAGSQMDMLGLSISLKGKEFLFNENVAYPDNYYRGKYLENISLLVQKEFGDEIFYDESRYREIASYAKSLVLDIIIKDLKDLNIEFDSFVYESTLYDHWDETKLLLDKNNALHIKDSKTYLKSTQYGDDADRVVIRDNKIPTYLAGDIIYHKNKFERSFNKYINIWGADHHGYIKRVKAAIEFTSFDSDKLEIILSQMVSLLKGGEPYKMSKRAGNVILLSDIVKEIGSDALRFIFLTKKSDTHLEFDLDILSKKDSSNPVFYINYAYARINQLFEKADIKKSDVMNESFESLDGITIDLAYQSLLLTTVLEEAFVKRDMQKITDYLNSLASLVHRFYSEQKIIDTENQNKYLKILLISSLSMKIGLKLLGITVKEKM